MTITYENADLIGNEFYVHDGEVTNIAIYPQERKIDIGIELAYLNQKINIGISEYVTFSTMDIAVDGSCLLFEGIVEKADSFGVEIDNYESAFRDVNEMLSEKKVGEYVAMRIRYKSGDVIKAVCKQITYDVIQNE